MSGATISDAEWAAFADAARAGVERRRATGDTSVPGFPEAEAEADNHRPGHTPADHNWTPAEIALIRSNIDQVSCANAEASWWDNTAHLTFSARYRKLLASVMHSVHTWQAHFLYTDQDPVHRWVWKNHVHDGPDSNDYTQAAINGNMLGVLPRSRWTDVGTIYVLPSGKVHDWLRDYVPTATQVCAVGRCVRGGIGTEFPGTLLVSARGQWIIASCVCDKCHQWLSEA